MPALSPELERAVLGAIARGYMSATEVQAETLSVDGRRVLAALAEAERAGRVPIGPDALVLLLAEKYGLARDDLGAYVRSVYASVGTEVADVALRSVRSRYLLVELVNEASDQLRKGTCDLSRLLDVVGRASAVAAPESLATTLAAGFPEPPRRIPVPSLPATSERLDGGLIGLTVLAGEPGVGKSTLALQIALDVAGATEAVLYYDLENGLAVTLDRIRRIAGDDVARARALTERLYYRDHPRTLEYDLRALPAPTLVIVDSVQKLPTTVEYRRAGLDRWVHRLEGLKRSGYDVLLVSEIPRSQYGREAYIGAYKESGEIEYAADLGLQMMPTDSGAALHVVKNRHGVWRGHVAMLSRDRTGFRWVEDW